MASHILIMHGDWWHALTLDAVDPSTCGFKSDRWLNSGPWFPSPCEPYAKASQSNGLLSCWSGMMIVELILE